MTSFCNLLEEDVVEVIFSWLPADSLIRFKCVNKSCYSLISALINNPTFVSNHLHNTKNNKSSMSLLSRRPCLHNNHIIINCHCQKKFSLMTLNNVDGICNEDDIVFGAEHLNLSLFSDGQYKYKLSEWRLGLHCDGIICLLGEDEDIILCNPTLQEFKLLPKPESVHDGWEDIGIGYDFRANDYKLVKLHFRHHFSAAVYTLATGSWRQINNIPLQDFPVCPYFVHHLYIYWKGVCYWGLCDVDVGPWVVRESMILCFDMSDELFYTIPFPENIASHQVFFVVWNDSFALFSFSEERENQCSVSIEIWVIDDNFDVVKPAKGACPWIKQLVVGPLVDVKVPLRLMNSNCSNEFLMVDTDRRVFLFNPRTQKLSTVNGVDGWMCLHATSYVKSLVSIGGGRELNPVNREDIKKKNK